MFDVMEMPLDWPAEVNYHESKAFCAWKGSDYRLPTEAEHHVMREPQVSQCLAQMIEFKICLQMEYSSAQVLFDLKEIPLKME